jgi:hypothetical protein
VQPRARYPWLVILTSLFALVTRTLVRREVSCFTT